MSLGSKLSMRSKIFLAFFITIVLGYGLILWYLIHIESDLVIKHQTKVLSSSARERSHTIVTYLTLLQREVLFLSSLDIMDDLLADDIDKRITRLLEKKATDYGRGLAFVAVNLKGKVVAASNKSWMSQEANSSSILYGLETHYHPLQHLEDALIYTLPLKSSFDDNTIGYLVMIYPYNALSIYTGAEDGYISWLTPASEHTQHPTLFAPSQKLLEATMSLSVEMPAPFKGWQLNYGIDKEKAFELLYHIRLILILFFVILLLLITILVWFIHHRFIEPIVTLSKSVTEITRREKFDAEVVMASQREIQELGEAFNTLLYTVSSTLKRVESQSHEHQQNLIQLIGFFNEITLTQTPEETIERAIKELKVMVDSPEAYLSHHIETKNAISIPVALKASQEESGEKSRNFIVIKNPQRYMMIDGSFFDAISQMISLQIENIRLLKTTQKALEMKSSFLSAMSHELRTPLGSILSIIQLLMISEQIPTHDKENLQKIESSALHLLRIINDILALARMESSHVKPEIVYFDLHLLLRDIDEMLNPLAEEKELLLSTRCSGEQLFVKSDPKIIKQIMINLISNAIKYTNQGFIQVVCKNREGGEIEIVITDSGIGIEREHLSYIFDEFYRSRHVENNTEGSGLGLSLSRELTNIIKGTLIIESQGIGYGTTATLRFTPFV